MISDQNLDKDISKHANNFKDLHTSQIFKMDEISSDELNPTENLLQTSEMLEQNSQEDRDTISDINTIGR